MAKAQFPFEKAKSGKDCKDSKGGMKKDMKSDKKPMPAFMKKAKK